MLAKWSIFFSLLVTLALIGCATRARDLDVRGVAVQTFGTDRNLVVHQVEYEGWIRGKLSKMGSRDDYAIWTEMQPATGREVNLVIWSGSSKIAAQALLRALKYPGVEQLPKLRLLYVGDAKDAKKVQPAVEATGAKFYFRQR